MNNDYNGYKIGDTVFLNGFPGRIIALCLWDKDNMMVDVRTDGGDACIDAYDSKTLTRRE